MPHRNQEGYFPSSLPCLRFRIVLCCKYYPSPPPPAPASAAQVMDAAWRKLHLVPPTPMIRTSTIGREFRDNRSTQWFIFDSPISFLINNFSKQERSLHHRNQIPDKCPMTAADKQDLWAPGVLGQVTGDSDYSLRCRAGPAGVHPFSTGPIYKVIPKLQLSGKIKTLKLYQGK